MTRRPPITGAIILSILILITLAPYMQNPEIYKKTPAEFSTRYHDDPGIYMKTDLDASGSCLLLMQEMLTISGPITENIKQYNLESSLGDLEKYKDLLGRTDKLSIQFQLNETDLGEYFSTQKKNQRILSDFLNQTTDLRQRKHLENQLKDQGKTGDFTSLVFEESAIRKRMDQLYEQYRQNEVVVNTTATKYGLDDFAYQESLNTIGEIVRKENLEQAEVEQQADLLKTTPSNLTLNISPAKGAYGDTLHITGYVRNVLISDLNQSTRIFIEDGGDWESRPDVNGRYDLNYPIGNISKGRHNTSSSYGKEISTAQSFEVLPADSTISLSATITEDPSGAAFSGQVLTAGQVPVHDAPVTLIWDEGNTTTVITDAGGMFHTEVPLSRGDHTVQALFAGEGYPVNASYSEMVSVAVPGHISPISIVAIATIMAFSLGVAASYLRWKRAEPGKNLDTSSHQSPKEWIAPTPEMDLERYTEDTPDLVSALPRNFDQWVAESGHREAAFHVYLAVLDLIKKDSPTSVNHSLTPHEVASRCQDRQYSASFLKFTRIYEKVRYGSGPVTDEEIQQFIDQAAAVIRHIGKDDRD